MKNSVLIIGLDGVSWGLLKPWINGGNLPTFSKLLKAGAEGDLRTTVPPISCSAWTSLFTGKNPGKHGIYEYTTDFGELVNSRSIKVEKIWQILSHHNKRCCVINVPMTYPVEKINGCMVSGILTPPQEKIYSYPPELMSILKKHDYQIRIEYGKHRNLPNQEYIIKQRFILLKKLYDLLKKRYSTLKELMNEKNDFFMFVFGQEIAMLQHLFFDRKDVMLEFFKKIDFYVGDLIETFSSRNTNPHIFIVSDHGFSRSPTRSVNMRAWLQENGILVDHRTFIQKIIPKIYKKLNILHLSQFILLFNKTKKTRDIFQRNLTKSSNVYYKSSGVYIKKDLFGKNEYEKLRDKLIQELKNLQDPLTNEDVFQIVEKREEIYSGIYSKFTPDIIALANSNYHITFAYDSNVIFDNIKIHLKGKHFSDMDGMFLAYGKEIQSETIKNASILDIFPTVLHILDVPMPKDLDGQVLKDIFKKNSQLFNKKVNYSEARVKTLQEKNDIKGFLQDVEV